MQYGYTQMLMCVTPLLTIALVLVSPWKPIPGRLGKESVMYFIYDSVSLLHDEWNYDTCGEMDKSRDHRVCEISQPQKGSTACFLFCVGFVVRGDTKTEGTVTEG